MYQGPLLNFSNIKTEFNKYLIKNRRKDEVNPNEKLIQTQREVRNIQLDILYVQRDKDPFKEMYLKIYKVIKHTLIRTVLFTHACLQESVTGQVLCGRKQLLEDSEEATKWGGGGTQHSHPSA
jgi:hypothetical protein